MSEFLSADFLKFFLPLAGGAAGYWLNERRKRRDEEYVRKEERYRALLSSLRGFYAEAEDPSLKQEFANQYGLCWLYCPDDVIGTLNAFLILMKEGAQATNEQKTAALAKLIGTIRRDLLSKTAVRKTNLTGLEFERLSIPPTPIRTPTPR